MTAIVVLSIPGQELSHERGDSCSAASDQEMDMRFHKRPSLYRRLRLDDVFPQVLKKTRPILVVFKNRCFVNFPDHNMVKGARDI